MSERDFRHAIVDRCDFETVVQDRYGPGCMQRRNRYMVDHAARLIAVFDGQDGGTRRTVEYALRSGLEVIYVDAEYPPSRWAITFSASLRKRCDSSSNA